MLITQFWLLIKPSKSASNALQFIWAHSFICHPMNCIIRNVYHWQRFDARRCILILVLVYFAINNSLNKRLFYQLVILIKLKNIYAIILFSYFVSLLVSRRNCLSSRHQKEGCIFYNLCACHERSKYKYILLCWCSNENLG